MLLDPLKHVRKNFEIDPSFVAKVMRLFVFAYCETPPGLRKISKNQKISYHNTLSTQAPNHSTLRTQHFWDPGRANFAPTPNFSGGASLTNIFLGGLLAHPFGCMFFRHFWDPGEGAKFCPHLWLFMGRGASLANIFLGGHLPTS